MSDQPPEQGIEMTQFPVTIASTGRPAMIMVPADCTDSELAELCGWFLTAVLNTLRQSRPASKIVIPKPTLIVKN